MCLRRPPWSRARMGVVPRRAELAGDQDTGERKPVDEGGDGGRVIKKDGEEAVKTDVKNVLEGDIERDVKFQTTGSYCQLPVYEQQASKAYQSSYHHAIEYYNLE